MRDVLVVQWSRLGDVLQTRPLLRSLKSEPHCRVILSCDERYADIAAMIPEVDHIAPMPLEITVGIARGSAIPLEVFRRCCHDIQRVLRPDAEHNASVLSRSEAAALFPSSCKIKAVTGYRYQGGRIVIPEEIRWLEDQCASHLDPRVHLSDLWTRMANLTACPSRLKPLASEQGTAGDQQSYTIGIICDSGDPLRTPPAAWLAALSESLRLTGDCTILLLGMHTVKPDALATLAGSRQDIVDLRGATTLKELAKRLASCSLVIGPDTGALHLAAAVGAQTLGLFSSGASPHTTGVYHEQALSLEILNWDHVLQVDVFALVTALRAGRSSLAEFNTAVPLWKTSLDEFGLIQQRLDKPDAQATGRHAARREFFARFSVASKRRPTSTTPTDGLSIIIPEQGQAHYTDSLLHQLKAWLPAYPVEIIVVSSGEEALRSAPTSAQRMKWIRVTERLTFAEACNHGATAATQHWLLFLNNDTDVSPEALERLAADRRPQCLLSPIVLYPDAVVQNAGVNIYDGEITEIGHGLTNVPAQTPDALSGIALLIERDSFRALNGFDSGFKNGYEDLDLSLRAKNAGHTLKICAAATIIHYRSGTPGRFEFEDVNRERFFARWGRSAPTRASKLLHVRDLAAPLILMSEESAESAGPQLRWLKPLAAAGGVSERDFGWLNIEPHSTFGEHAKAAILRAKCVVCFRAVRNKALQELLTRRDKRQCFITDSDDLILDRFRSGSAREVQYREYSAALEHLIHHADLNIAATEAIAVSIQRHGAHAIVLPTLPDSANVSSTIRDATRTGIRLAFVGNPAHAVDLGMILPALEAILDENENAMFYWWGCRPGELAYHPQVRQGGPRVESYANHLHRLRGMHIDIALVPMLPTEVNRARSPIKYYDWTALGVPGIYSNILPFESVISPNQNGLLVDDRAESWYNAMKNLCNSPERRTQLGAGAQTHVRFLAAARNQDNLFQQLLQGNYPRKREQSHMSSTAGAYHVA